jgi:hypothetical protein
MSDHGVAWRDGEAGIEYVERTAGIVDAGRERLRTQHFELVYGQRASLVVPRARAAVDQLKAMIRQRTEQMATRQVIMPGSAAWEPLRTEFSKACVPLRDVCAALEWDVECLLIDDIILPSPTPLDNVRLYVVQRNNLVSAQQQLGVKTRQLVNCAAVLFASGYSASVLWTR